MEVEVEVEVDGMGGWRRASGRERLCFFFYLGCFCVGSIAESRTEGKRTGIYLSYMAVSELQK